jgi:hypothetical protein
MFLVRTLSFILDSFHNKIRQTIVFIYQIFQTKWFENTQGGNKNGGFIVVE